MAVLPRLALGTIQPGVNLQPLLFAILAACRRVGLDVQVFGSQSCFDGWGGVPVLPGQRLRHLDSWLMNSRVSQEFLVRGGAAHDLALVVGSFCARERREGPVRGGELRTLCQDLNLPRIAVVDVSRWDACRPPELPADIQAILLLGCRPGFECARWQTRLEWLWGVPVWGSVLGEAACCETLARELTLSMRLATLLELAASAPRLPDAVSAPPRLARDVHVAIAYDEAFHCYFPDTMEALESIGARVTDFSPLKSETLPPQCDVVWLGCGHPEAHAARLMRNICLQNSLRAHVYAGGRVYAEGGGLAYACESIECEGRRYPMAGLLPVEACWQSAQAVAGESQPVELQGGRAATFGGEPLRGYLNPHWRLQAPHGLRDYSAETDCPMSLVGDGPVLGSRIHLHFASQPKLLQALLHPVVTNGSSGVE